MLQILVRFFHLNVLKAPWTYCIQNWNEIVLHQILFFPLLCFLHPKGDQSWVFIGRSDFEAETAVLWPPDAKSWLIWKDPDAQKDWGQEEKGTTEDKMVGWHHRLNGYGFGWTLGAGVGQGGLACCGSWGRKESDMTKRLNWTELFPLLVGSKRYLHSHLYPVITVTSLTCISVNLCI